MAHSSPCAFVRTVGTSLFAAAALQLASPAAAQAARIRQINDIAFGTVGVAPVDIVRTDPLCVYSTASAGRYTITARGSGFGNAFTLAGGGNTLPYEVQWAFAGGSSSGTMLSPNVPLAGTTTNKANASCNQAALQNATLIVVLRAAAQQSAMAGSYSGTLTLIIEPN